MTQRDTKKAQRGTKQILQYTKNISVQLCDFFVYFDLSKSLWYSSFTEYVFWAITQRRTRQPF